MDLATAVEVAWQMALHGWLLLVVVFVGTLALDWWLRRLRK